MKSFLVIGAGKFGCFVCKYLFDLGCDVLLVDESEEKLSSALAFTSGAKIGDCTKRDVLNSFGVDEFDAAIVCIPEDFQNSLQITDLLKDLNCPRVIAVASTEVQAKFLLKNGADKIVFPEKDMARRLAVTISNDSIFDYINLSNEFAIFEIIAPAKWNGKSIQTIDVRKRFNVNIVAVKAPNGKVSVPGISYVFNADDHIMVLGSAEAINRLI